MTSELQCYRKGCTKTYLAEENKADSCCYHPGAPVFHDALKYWSCCEKKSTDFSVFLDMPGCSTGFHSNEKPPPIPKVESKPLPDELVIRGPPPKTLQRSERPDINEPLANLTSTVGATLKTALAKRLANLALQQDNANSELADGEVAIGTSCKNNGCQARYQGESSKTEVCIFHPGIPIFHEGLKFWSCCQKKTTEFDKFMDQVGCETGIHKWVASKDAAKQTSCRMDWHQTGSSVTLSVFAKCADPSKTIVKANKVSVDVHIVFEDDKIYSEKIELCGIIDVAKSNVKLLGSKVEVVLKKGSPESWAQLHYKPHPTETKQAKD